MKFSKLILVLGLLLVLVSASVLVAGFRSRQTSAVAAPAVSVSAETVAPAPEVTAVSGTPVRLRIPALGYDLPVIDGYYDTKTGEWTLTKDKVQYAKISSMPNDQAGNTFLYGHYRKEVFATLHTIPTDAVAIVDTSNGHSFYYKFTIMKTVSPEESAGIFVYDGKPRLTIQTCSGIFFQNRQLFMFDLERVE